MRMAKQRRKYERRLERAGDIWRADQATIAAKDDERLATMAGIRKVIDSHSTILRQDPYGRKGSMRAFCTYCVTNAAPCPTVKSLTRLLDQMAGRV